MHIEVRRVEYQDVEALRGLYRQESHCQIIHDSFLARGLADPYLILVGGRVAGYGAVSNKYGKGRLMEFYTLPDLRASALRIFRKLLATRLFHDAFVSHLACTNGVFRHATPEDNAPDSEGEWVIEANDAIVAMGGFLCHYNPPYGDIYMNVVEPARRKGFGSFLVQELKRVCYEAGKRPAARCNTDNVGSRRTLEKAGMLPCGRILVGKVRPVTI